MKPLAVLAVLTASATLAAAQTTQPDASGYPALQRVLTKLRAENAELKAQLATLTAENGSLKAKIAELQPSPPPQDAEAKSAVSVTVRQVSGMPEKYQGKTVKISGCRFGGLAGEEDWRGGVDRSNKPLSIAFTVIDQAGDTLRYASADKKRWADKVLAIPDKSMFTLILRIAKDGHGGGIVNADVVGLTIER